MWPNMPYGIHNNRVRTCWENLDQQIIDKSIDYWRDKLKAVGRLNGTDCTVVLTIWFICCYALLCSVCVLRTLRAFCHCVSSVMIALRQKVNLANN